MLLGTFFKITTVQRGEKHIVGIELNPQHELYKGHFPGNPVAPGVCLTQMVKETVEYITNQKLSMVTGDNIKFTAVLNPEINPSVTMVIALKTKENGLLQADSTISSGELNFFSFKGSFKQDSSPFLPL